MKCHIGVDAFSGLVHTIEVTSANVHDVSVAAKLIREDDEVVYGDSGYLGIDKREEVVSDEHLSSIDYRINRRPSSLQKVSDNSFDWDRMIEHAKSSVRCKVEHPFHIVKCLFGYKKVLSCDKIKYHYNYFLPGVSHRRQASLRQRRAKAAFLPIMQ